MPRYDLPPPTAVFASCDNAESMMMLVCVVMREVPRKEFGEEIATSSKKSSSRRVGLVVLKSISIFVIKSDSIFDENDN